MQRSSLEDFSLQVRTAPSLANAVSVMKPGVELHDTYHAVVLLKLIPLSTCLSHAIFQMLMSVHRSCRKRPG